MHNTQVRLPTDFSFSVLNLTAMILLESSKSGYTYIGSDNNYYAAVRNDDCGAPDEIYPLVLGPITPQEFDEIPF